MFENINLWFAKDENDEIITIDKINEDNKHNTYTCPICGSEVIARTGEIKIHHFAHKDKSKCSSETMIHWWLKNKLIEVGDTFSIRVDKNIKKEFTCKELYVEREYNTDFGKYRPDVTILADTGELIYFEIDYTNKKKVEEYIDKWLCLNNTVVEVSVKDMVNNNINQLKAVFYNGKCYNINNSEARYHNTIGAYKQKIFNQEEIIRAKARLNKINWFWEECRKYRMNKSDEITFFDVIDCLDVKDKEYVIDGLLKSNCTSVRKLYLYNKQKYIIKYIKEFCKNNKISLTVEDGDYNRFSQMFEKSFRVPYVYILDFGETFYCDIFDEGDLCRQLNNYISKEYCNEIINNINNKLASNYSISGICDNDGLFITAYYKDNEIFKNCIYDIRNTDIECNMLNIINEYRENLCLCGFEVEILNYLKEKQNMIKSLKPIKYKNDLYLTIEQIYENKIKLHFINSKFDFIVTSNEIIGDKETLIFNTFTEFKYEIDKLLSVSIRKIRYNLQED